MSNTRSSYWDNLKGILICLVVFAHFLYDFTDHTAIEIIVFLIYVFHMPAFVFVSGHFTHDPPKIRKLVTAFILFDSAYLLCEFKLLGTIDILSPAYVCWYLVALIVWRLLAKYIPRKKYTIPCFFAVSLLVGLIPNLGNTFGLTRILAFFVFFVAGLLTDEDTVKKLRSKARPIFGYALLLVSIAGSITADTVFYYKKSDLVMLEYSSLDMVLGRAVMLILAGAFIISLLLITSDKRSFLTKLGKNSLPIFLVHRFITFVYSAFFPYTENVWLIIGTSALMTVLTLIILGNDKVASFVDELISGKFNEGSFAKKVLIVILPAFVLFLLILSKVLGVNTTGDTIWTEGTEPEQMDRIYRVLSAQRQEEYDDSVRIVFAGDLILLEDQVRLAYDAEEGTYDFSDLFEYTADEISAADLAIGVYEGPSGGEDLGYTTSNYDDGKELRLNFPDEFANAVADAGFDLVTTANNHLLDSGLDAALRTNDVLDEAGLMHIGTYANEQQRQENRVQIVEVSGMRIAVLAYTFGSNYHTEDEFFDGEFSSLTSVIVAEDSPYYERSLQMVEEDFDYAKSLEPDLIIVLPHMGTQFMDDADEFQTLWRQNFISLGADIVLGDHSHSVQPAFLEEVDGRMTFTAYCPGNYANIYREYNGDASALIEVFIDPDTHEITGGGVIPMWITAQADGNYRPIPVWDIVNDEEVRSSLTIDDLARVEEVHEHITEVVLGHALNIDMIEPDYLFDASGFLRRPCDPLELDEQMESSAIFESLTGAESVCFIGDSITQGTKNGGAPWYEPLTSYIEGDIHNLSYGGWTTVNIIENLGDLPEADVYVVAIGTNDVRYDNAEFGAATPEGYGANMETIRSTIRQVNPDCEIWFIAPWIAFDGDQVSPFPVDEVRERRIQFSDVLEQMCEQSGDHYIDPNDYIDNVVSHSRQTDYLLDWIHPNIRRGIGLYCEAVLLGSENN